MHMVRRFSASSYRFLAIIGCIGFKVVVVNSYLPFVYSIIAKEDCKSKQNLFNLNDNLSEIFYIGICGQMWTKVCETVEKQFVHLHSLFAAHLNSKRFGRRRKFSTGCRSRLAYIETAVKSIKIRSRESCFDSQRTNLSAHPSIDLIST